MPQMHKNILKSPDARLRQELSQAVKATAAAFPLKTAHKKALPYSVRDLSLLLTAERGQSQGYWQKPAFTGAYLYYFLPWNLLRLSWLLPNLNISLPAGARVLDLGSGPLTLPLALWLARPDLHDKALHLTCSDPAQRPMELGRAILEQLGGASGGWKTDLLRAPIDMALRKAGRVRLITAGNVLNEIYPKQETLEERLENIFYSMDRALEHGGQILLVEPGTRLGGKLIALMRRIALESGYSVEAPCTHQNTCPYAPPEDDDEQPRRGMQRQPSGWCHFSLSPDGAPEELTSLSRAADLEKERLSFSFLLLRKARNAAEPDEDSDLPGDNKLAHDKKNNSRQRDNAGGGVTPVRVISDPIRLGSGQSARYVCSSHGLGLLSEPQFYRSGSFAEAVIADRARRDAKSGAWLMNPKQPGTSKEAALQKEHAPQKKRPGQAADSEDKKSAPQRERGAAHRQRNKEEAPSPQKARPKKIRPNNHAKKN